MNFGGADRSKLGSPVRGDHRMPRNRAGERTL